jgi:hypothetical protein
LNPIAHDKKTTLAALEHGFLAMTDTNEIAQLVVGQFPQSAPALVRVVAIGTGWAG